MTDCLVIFAAGKSSRFSGFPKAFCSLGKIRNVENTICLAKPHFKEIYLVVNKETYASGITDGLDVNVISIVTGQGDADSILRAARIIRNKLAIETITACWGDAVFLSDKPFKEMEAAISVWDCNSPALVGCSVDLNPYAWFDIKDREISFSHFKKREDNPCEKGIHDQSIFMLHLGILIPYLERYKRYLGLDRYSEDSYDISRGEMGLLDSFTWFYAQPEMKAAEYCELTAQRVLGFNTPEELDSVANKLWEYRNERTQK